MVVHETQSETALARFLTEKIGEASAREIIAPIRQLLRFGDGEVTFPDKPLTNLLDHVTVRRAISAATRCEVLEIKELSLMKPFEPADWMTQEASRDATRAALLNLLVTAWCRRNQLSQILEERFMPILDRRSASFNRFLNGGNPITDLVAWEFGRIVSRRLGFNQTEIGACAESAVRWSLYYYIALQSIGDVTAEDLRVSVQALPMVVPICATDNEKRRWIVMVP